jgi:hypothetical protein
MIVNNYYVSSCEIKKYKQQIIDGQKIVDPYKKLNNLHNNAIYCDV